MVMCRTYGLTSELGWKYADDIISITRSLTQGACDFAYGLSRSAEHRNTRTAREEVQHGNPDPEIDLLAARKLSVPPEVFLLIEGYWIRTTAFSVLGFS